MSPHGKTAACTGALRMAVLYATSPVGAGDAPNFVRTADMRFKIRLQR